MPARTLNWGVLGAGWISNRAMLPAIGAARGARLVALASRDADRGAAMAREHGARRFHHGYERLLDDPEVEAVYVALVNSEHMEWTVRALEAGKHVLCEKPLALDAAQAERMAAAAEASGRLLMEALMYRFHPRMQRAVEDLRRQPVGRVSAWFGFRPTDPGTYRLVHQLGGGALYDVGCYSLSVCRWLLGEPDEVAAVARIDEATGVDMTVGATLGYAAGTSGYAWASMESPEEQALEVQLADRTARIETPFTAWRDPDDPYQLMVEAFSRAARRGEQAPIPIAESVAGMRVMDRVREAAGIRPVAPVKRVAARARGKRNSGGATRA